jgi:chromosomal replication initiator protein
MTYTHQRPARPAGGAAVAPSAVEKALRNSAGPALQRVWRSILDRLGERVSERDLDELIRPLEPTALTPAELRLQAPSRLVMLCVNDNLLPVLRQAIAEVIGPRQVHLDVRVREQGELFPEALPRRVDRRALALRAMLNPRYTFSNFVVGASNQFAHAASRAVASQPGHHYNPLFIYGGVGLGKTHLVNAIGHAVLDRRPDARVAYLATDTFVNDLISSLRRDRMQEFKQRLRGVDVLIVDDVQSLTGRERTQDEFFHTFNTLHAQHAQIVLTSDKVPKDIAGLEERLRSRFEWGLIADLQPPDVETRVAILERKAEIEGISISHEVALFLADQVASNVRELEGALTRLGAHASLHRHEITLEYAREAMQSLRPARQSPRVTYDAIVGAVCERFGLRPADLASRRRSRHVALPRQVAMYLCRRMLNASFPHLGELFQRDHSTVIHGVSTIEHRVKDDPSFLLTVEQLEEAIRRQQA